MLNIKAKFDNADIVERSLLYLYYDSEQAIWHSYQKRYCASDLKKVSKKENNSIKEPFLRNKLKTTSTNCSFVLSFPFELAQNLTKDRASMIGRQKLFNYRYPEELDCVLRIAKLVARQPYVQRSTVNIT